VGAGPTDGPRGSGPRRLNKATRAGEVVAGPRWISSRGNRTVGGVFLDPNTTNGADIFFTQPAAVLGDLIVAQVFVRANTAPWLVGVTGGQDWNKTVVHVGANHSYATFFCRFNGTWAADPSFLNTSTEGTVGFIHVFRPTDPNARWGLEQYALGSGAGTGFTITGVTPRSQNTVSLATVVSIDDNEYVLTTPGRWSWPGIKQQRTTGGADGAISTVYLTQAAPSATGNVTLTQATLGADAGLTMVQVFAESVDPGIGALVGRGRGPRNTDPRGLRKPTLGYENPVASADVTLALSGAEVTVSAGTLTDTVDVGLTGQSVTADAGTLTAAVVYTAALTGQAVTASAGTVLAATSRALTGQPVTASAGTVLAANTAPLTGTAVTASAGTILASLSVPLIGQVVSVESGTITFEAANDVIVALTGAEVTTYAGDLQASLVLTEDQPSGGYGAYNDAMRERARRKRLKELQELDELEAEADRLEMALAADGLLTASPAVEARFTVREYAHYADSFNRRTQRAIAYAERARTELAYQLAAQEIARQVEEEELAILLMVAVAA